MTARMKASRKRGRFTIMRHGETVYNATRRLQANRIYMPLPRAGDEHA